jgi:hypothetical protein
VGAVAGLLVGATSFKPRSARPSAGCRGAIGNYQDKRRRSCAPAWRHGVEVVRKQATSPDMPAGITFATNSWI